jgi:hypothetical protein
MQRQVPDKVVELLVGNAFPPPVCSIDPKRLVDCEKASFVANAVLLTVALELTRNEEPAIVVPFAR